ncbi:MAG: ribonuclease HII [Saprospiraceae bacterium]|nr:ribonuclease HII [Saprospiraceae bacterium]MCF8249967.1 ribonuclease HII [Saprospiraceae bacterium]MCF8278993.1 ribonuclease HII [Bacteroidales bacterium]MCF8310980.1 ribonuclease HII [Saprospiraceae bacterium]MCF8439684.1 ribonuclease HII [Saprospiraceae bacterium]
MLLPFFNKNETEAGCDEAGRGCLAGPVFAAAVILPKDFAHPFLNDSKQLTENQRVELRPIIEAAALAWAVAQLEPTEIDRLNILWASVEGMHRAVRKLELAPTSLLIDGNRFKPYPGIPHQCMVKGDARFLSIAAASVLAKTYRDEYMLSLSIKYPQYGWEQNKGYPTKFHRAAIRQHGATPEHRRSFRLLPAGEPQLSF